MDISLGIMTFMILSMINFELLGPLKILQKFITVTASNYNKIVEVFSFISGYNTNIINVVMISITLLIKTIYYKVKNYEHLKKDRNMSAHLKKLSHKLYELEYCIDGKKYIIVIHKHKGPKQILEILDENGNDVMHEIEPYLGPDEKFHGSSNLTPRYFNKKLLTFNKGLEDEKSFQEDDFIVIN